MVGSQMNTVHTFDGSLVVHRPTTERTVAKGAEGRQPNHNGTRAPRQRREPEGLGPHPQTGTDSNAPQQLVPYALRLLDPPYLRQRHERNSVSFLGGGRFEAIIKLMKQLMNKTKLRNNKTKKNDDSYRTKNHN